MRKLRWLGLFLAPALLLFAPQAGAAKPQANVVERTAYPVWTVAMDWPRVAYAGGKEYNSGTIRVWNVVTGRSSAVKSGQHGFAAHHAAEIAIAGKRIAWLRTQQFGNTELDHWLYTARLGGPPRLLKRTLGYTDTDCGLGGPQMDGLVGSENVMAVSTWVENSNGTDSWNKRLDLITPKGLRTIATGSDAIVSVSADGGHIAVVPRPPVSMAPGYCVSTSSTTRVVIRSSSGASLGEIAIAPPDPSTFVLGVALSGNRLVVLTGTQPDSGPATVTLDVYDWTTGALVHTWPVPIHQYLGEVSLEVSGQLAAVEGPYGLHLVGLNTGNEAVIGPAGAYAIGPRGLVHAVNTRSSGKLVFVPMAKLLALAS